jgi:integrase/recombinase XerD
MQPQFEQFIRERLYLVGVAPTTVDWYRRCLHWLPSEQPTQADLKDMELRMRQKGLKETGVNSVIRCINAYLHWASGSERRCDSGCTHLRVNKVKEPKQVMPTFTEAQMKRLVHWKPSTKHDKRLHLLVLFLLDTGCRVSEALTLHVTDVDLDNMLVTLDGKGRKQRIVQLNCEGRFTDS